MNFGHFESKEHLGKICARLYNVHHFQSCYHPRCLVLALNTLSDSVWLLIKFGNVSLQEHIVPRLAFSRFESTSKTAGITNT